MVELDHWKKFPFPVYGNTVEIANELRTFHDGLLKNNKNKVLPETCDDPTIDCYLTGRFHRCRYLTTWHSWNWSSRLGDFRGTGIFFLGILQSMYHRFHNIVAVQLKALNPKWSDERIYQESRRVVIACYQNHVIDWLRVFAGKFLLTWSWYQQNQLISIFNLKATKRRNDSVQ